MNRIIVIFAICIAIFAPSSPATQAFSLMGNSTSTNTESSGIFKTLSTIDEKKAILSETENTIQILQEKIFGEEESLKILEEKYQAIKSTDDDKGEKISPAHIDFFSFLELSEKEYLERDITTIYNEKKAELNNILGEKKRESIQNRTQAEEDIQILTKEIELLNKQYKDELSETFFRFGGFVVIFFLLFFVQRFLSTFLENNGEKYGFSEQKIIALKNITKWIFNGLYIIIILVFFSVQILSFLPFLAILGTAIAFALRDIISSFIAWFLIGTKSGYKEGDVIAVGDSIFGKVIQISSFVTELQELGMNGSTGKYVTFPNNKIFKGKIQNWWKRKGFIFSALDFYLTQDSNTKKARQILQKVMEEQNQENMILAEKEKKALKIFGVKSESMEPRTYLDIRPQGVFIRGKMMIHFEERHDTRTNVTEHFLEEIQKHDDITLRLLQNDIIQE